MQFPASALMHDEEERQRRYRLSNSPPGMPTNIQHDMHRLVGWSRQLGLYLDGQMVRVLGQIDVPENEEEKQELESRANEYWTRYHGFAASFQTEIQQRAAIDLSTARPFMMEAAFFEGAGIASTLYPEFFVPGNGNVDKDGLTHYRHLRSVLNEIQPGVFHDPSRDLLLFAHRFFRRSLSHRNKLNAEFLQLFAQTINDNPNLFARLRLDPDIIGHPNSAKNLIELEYLRGPYFNNDISKIPPGVTEHKADETTRDMQGVDRTQFWWKSPEMRETTAGKNSNYRTFEVEELIEDASPGLNNEQFGCRYAHAEFSEDEATITHFDGAIRAYFDDAYLNRIATSIDRAGKHSNYSKLFRLDGALPIKSWKELLTYYFRSNKLVPEYLGTSVSDDNVTATSVSEAGTSIPELAALIVLEPGELNDSEFVTFPQLTLDLVGKRCGIFELGSGQVANFLRQIFDFDSVPTCGFTDGVLNLCCIALTSKTDIKKSFDRVTSGLAESLKQDFQNGLTQYAAIPIQWEYEGLLVTLSVAGNADKVAAALEELQNTVDPCCQPSDWIQQLSDAIKLNSSDKPSSVLWEGVDYGALQIKRAEETESEFLLPEKFLRTLSMAERNSIDELVSK